MHHDFWHERWRRGEIGFHRTEVHWALERYWDRIAASAGAEAEVLVPLCGKSLDLVWLAERGHRVQGIELSRKAIAEFFAEAERVPTQRSHGELTGWASGPIELFEGDFFAFEPELPLSLFYDRAALVALPEAMRRPYLVKLRSVLADTACGLLVSFESDPVRYDGPPFDVTEAELRQAAGLDFELLEQREVLASHPRRAEQGTNALHESVWRVQAC